MKKDTERRPPLSAIASKHLDEETIRRRAYELYLDRGMEDGRDVEDWFRAEQELAGRTSRSAAA